MNWKLRINWFSFCESHAKNVRKSHLKFLPMHQFWEKNQLRNSSLSRILSATRNSPVQGIHRDRGRKGRWIRQSVCTCASDEVSVAWINHALVYRQRTQVSLPSRRYSIVSFVGRGTERLSASTNAKLLLNLQINLCEPPLELAVACVCARSRTHSATPYAE